MRCHHGQKSELSEFMDSLPMKAATTLPLPFYFWYVQPSSFPSFEVTFLYLPPSPFSIPRDEIGLRDDGRPLPPPPFIPAG